MLSNEQKKAAHEEIEIILDAVRVADDYAHGRRKYPKNDTAKLIREMKEWAEEHEKS